MKSRLSHALAMGTAVLTLSATAADFHVAPNDNDANPGSADKPLVTLENFRAADAASLGVVPAVQQWDVAHGTFALAKDNTVIGVEVKHATALADTAKVLQEDMAAMGFTAVRIQNAAAPAVGGIFLTLDGAPDGHGKEAYSLAIGEGAVIRGASPSGVFYGTRTLLQMHKQASLGAMRKGTVTDWPETRGRMLMFDAGRKPFPVPVVKDYLRQMAWNKMNEFHFHLSDECIGGYTAYRIESRKFPGLTARDFFYSWADLRELQDFAKARGITITPEIDMPGHALCLINYWPELKHPKLKALDVTNPRMAEQMKELLAEAIPLFDAPDFHIGTDEYRLGGLNEEEKKVTGEAFRKFINEMNAFVRSKGKNCRIWSGWSHMPGSTEPDPTVTIDMWLGSNAKELIAKGHHVINSADQRTYIVPGAHCYGVSDAAIYDNWNPWNFGGEGKNPDKNDPHLLGGKLHVWLDQGPGGYTSTELADATFPSMQVFAEKMWGVKGSKDVAEFRLRSQGVAHAPDVTVLVEKAPGVVVLDRMSGGSREPGVFFSMLEEKTLGNVNSMENLPWAIAPRADLEYPWTLTMEIQKTAETGDRGVIISSDLAELCSDYTTTDTKKTKSADGREIKTQTTRHGIGLVRSAATFGKDPASSPKAHHVSRVYSEPLPLNQWVKLTVVAERGKTTVYLDGKKTGEARDQMICPLRWFGSKTGHSFVGKVRNLRLYDQLSSKKEQTP